MMTRRLSAAISLIALLAVGSATAGELAASDDAVHIRATVELTDGSRLIGTAADQPLSLTLDYAHLDIPLARIRRWDAVTPTNKRGGDADRTVTENKVTVQLTNGDRLTGTLNQPQLQLDTLLGPMTAKLQLVRSVAYSAWREGNMPPSANGDLAFGGLNWLTWRTDFVVEGDRVRSLPKARPGFQYGHEGHGRGAALMANIGDSDWRDYSIEAQFCASGIDPAFNPYGLGGDWHDGDILFHLADAKESQNERGNSCYMLGLHSDGSWELRAVYNTYCDQPIGWGSPRSDGERTLAHGAGLALDRQIGNHIRIDILGNRIQIWFDDQSLVDVVDNQMGQEIAGQRLDHGGIGFTGGFESMFWLKDVSVRALDAQRGADVRR
jgi:hypothetical protein